MTQLGLSNELGRFISEPFFLKKNQAETSESRKLRQDAFDLIKMGLSDTVATMYAGKNEEVAQILHDLLCQESEVFEGKEAATFNNRFAPVPVFQSHLTLQNAAFLNATLGHALDYDDVALSGHPSVVLGPCVLAVAHALDQPGYRALEAYWVGYEVWAELLSREKDPYHLKGWHPTAVLGTVACAAAVAHLYELDANTSTHAVSLAASMAAGLTANFGSMSKPMQAGRAAFNAIEAVAYAKRGIKASSAVFESKAGFLDAISPKGNVDLAGQAKCLFTSRIIESRLSIKQYPLCYSAHRVIDAVLDAQIAHDFQHQDVAHVQAWIGPAQASMLRNHLPQTALQAKFSLEFAVACALYAKKVGLTELKDEFVLLNDIQHIMQLVEVHVVDTQCPIDPAFSMNDRVVIELKNATVIDSGDIRFCRGNAYLPLSTEALKKKFLECCQYGQVASDEYALNLFDKLSHLEHLKSIRTLFNP